LNNYKPWKNYQLKDNLTSQQKESANTSITRGGKKSMPLRHIEPELLKSETINDIGAGRGVDYQHMLHDGRKVSACDPFTNLGPCQKAKTDVVISNYVLNTIRPVERKKALDTIKDHTKDRAYITVRRTGDKTTPSPDGFITGKGTFQKYSEPEELKKYVKKDFKTVKINKNITNADSSSVVASDPK
jgi:hypothetical protein